MPKQPKARKSSLQPITKASKEKRVPLRIVDVRVADIASAVLRLLTDGVAVFPLLNEEEVHAARLELNSASKAYPEFKKEYVKDGMVLGSARFVGGSFGCLGSPASFHCKAIRRLRVVIHRNLMLILRALEAHPTFIEVFPGLDGAARFLEHIIDRFCARKPGTGTPESWHIDQSPTANASDAIIGGWLNLGPTDQFFVCQLGSHVAAWEGSDPLRKVGFTPIKDPLQRAALDATGVQVRIPVGCIVMFFQNTRHAVHTTTKKAGGTLPTARLYFGARISHDARPLGGTEGLVQALIAMGPVKVKSNQDANMYPDLYKVSGIALLEAWSQEAFDAELPGLMEKAHVKSTGYEYVRVKQLCPSYKELGILDRPDVAELCPAYTDDEIAMHMPVLARAV